MEERAIKGKILTGELAMFAAVGMKIADCTFEDGESPLKESADLEIIGSMFKWKYPLWYCRNVSLENCTFYENARAGVWYTRGISFRHGIIEAPKTFRRSTDITLEDVFMPNAFETLWNCSDVKLRSVRARGDYFAMNVSGGEVDGLDLVGNYAFDGAKNVTVRNARMLTKDAFWNCENVTVIDSFISGEYLGWNSRNLTLINCTIESLQGMCYIEDLVLDNCRLVNTTLAFEYSKVEADIVGTVDSVKNPTSGRICADGYGEIIMEADKVDVSATEIITRGKQA